MTVSFCNQTCALVASHSAATLVGFFLNAALPTALNNELCHSHLRVFGNNLN